VFLDLGYGLAGGEVEGMLLDTLFPGKVCNCEQICSRAGCFSS
jgi:hypothetical protein